MQKIGNALTTATLLLVFTVAWSCSAFALPSACLSPKFDGSIASAVGIYWRDFSERFWWKAQLCQESHLNPDAVSPVGAQGLAQIMPATYAEIVRTLHWQTAANAFDPSRAIEAGAYYQGRQRRAWSSPGRTGEDRNRLGACAYNAGLGSCLSAQRACKDARLWEDIQPCLFAVTGKNATETTVYVNNITTYAGELKQLGR